MSQPLALALVPVVAYLVGAIPFALLIGRAVGVDLRNQGTGNLGAGNLTRLAGVRYGATAAIADGCKGLVPVLVARRIGLPAEVAAVGGVAGVVGHNWSIYLRGRAGRGLAAAVGVIVAVAPALLIWTTLWAGIGWKMGGGLGGFVGWGLLPGYAVMAGQSMLVVAVALVLTAVILLRRAQGGFGDLTGWRPSLIRMIWDTDSAPAAPEPGKVAAR